MTQYRQMQKLSPRGLTFAHVKSSSKSEAPPMQKLSPPRTDAGTVLSIFGKYTLIWTGLGHNPKIALSAQILRVIVVRPIPILQGGPAVLLQL